MGHNLLHNTTHDTHTAQSSSSTANQCCSLHEHSHGGGSDGNGGQVGRQQPAGAVVEQGLVQPRYVVNSTAGGQFGPLGIVAAVGIVEDTVVHGLLLPGTVKDTVGHSFDKMKTRSLHGWVNMWMRC